MDRDLARVGAVLLTATELAIEGAGGKILKNIPGSGKLKKEFMDKVMNAAMKNDKIRAVVIQGSRQLGEGMESVTTEVSRAWPNWWKPRP